LAIENPVIFGLLWLSRHDLAIDWKTLWITFQKYYCEKYLPLQARVKLTPRAQSTTGVQSAFRGVETTPIEGERPIKEKKKVRFHMIMEEVEDEGEEQLTTYTLVSHTFSSI
jgi:hypothetical protein